MPTREEIIKAVLYAHEKPELLADIIMGLIPDSDNQPEEPKD